MTWLVLRQHRATLITFGALLAVFALAMLLLTADIRSFTTDNNLLEADCASQGDTVSAACAAFEVLYANIASSGMAGALLLGVPGAFRGRSGGVPGAFLGAVVVSRDLAGRTHLLAWTQGVTRRRWFLARLAVTGSAVIAFAVVSSLLLQQFLDAYRSVMVFIYPFYENPLKSPDVSPVLAWTLPAFALAAVTGTLTRRVLPALAVGLVGYLVLFFLLPVAVQRLATPIVRDVTAQGALFRAAAGRPVSCVFVTVGAFSE